MVKKIIGIYGIQHKISKLIYIGSSRNVVNRWRRHKWMLRLAKHSNPYLQNAWNKCGEEAFEFIILEEVVSLENLFVRERYWMDFYKSYLDNYGYNAKLITKGDEQRYTPKELERAGKHIKEAWDRRKAGAEEPHFIKEYWINLDTTNKTRLELQQITGLSKGQISVYLKRFGLTFKHLPAVAHFKPYHFVEFWLTFDTKNKTKDELVEETGLAWNTIARYLKKFNLTFRSLLEDNYFKKGHISTNTGNHEGINNGNMKYALLQDYEWCLARSKENLTAKQIAELAKAPDQVVYRSFKKFNLSFTRIDVRFKKGLTSWTTGVGHSEITKQKISQTKLRQAAEKKLLLKSS